MIKKVVKGTGSGLAGLHMKKHVATLSCLPSLGISQPWEGQPLQCQQGPSVS